MKKAQVLLWVWSLWFLGLGMSGGNGQTVSTNWSIARVWDEEILRAIRIDLPNPPVHARNLFHLSVAMYDVWAAYDNVAVGYLYHQKHTSTNLALARREAISYAAYRVLTNRYILSVSNNVTVPRLAATLASLGYDPGNNSTNTATAAGLGNSIANIVINYYNNDEALQALAYKDSSYRATNQ